MWQYTGKQRPDFAIEPGPEEESVWDYPRPPALVPCSQHVVVKTGDMQVASSDRCMRVLETASPPTFYIPPDDIDMRLLTPATGASFCEWKGMAQYWALSDSPTLFAVAWSYPHPSRPFAEIRDWLCFYPGRIECFVDGETVKPQPGGFYGGWVTDNIVGPCKGDPGTSHW